MKWFSGGNDRKKQAIIEIDNILSKMERNEIQRPIMDVLNKYKTELEKKETPVPMILNRMNLEISQTLINNKITLNEDISENLKKLQNISQIRYGYNI